MAHGYCTGQLRKRTFLSLEKLLSDDTLLEGREEQRCSKLVNGQIDQMVTKVLWRNIKRVLG